MGRYYTPKLDTYTYSGRGEKVEEKNIQEHKYADVSSIEGEVYLVGASYDGAQKKAYLKLYDPRTATVYRLYDNVGHKPYCYAKEPLNELEKNIKLLSHPGLEKLEVVKKIDPLIDKPIDVVKIVAKDPLDIGGKPKGTIRELVKAWEADIRYYKNYLYDRQLIPGLPYRVVSNELKVPPLKLSEKIEKLLAEIFKGESEEHLRYLKEWAFLLEYPVPHVRRVALDIEVATDIPTRVPDPREAKYPVVCVSLIDSDGEERVLLLKRQNVEMGERTDALPQQVKVEFFDNELDLIKEVFRVIDTAPFLVTFNGDDFDLRYLFHRAEKRYKISREQIPLELGRESISLKYGIHIDLYKFFFNRSLQVYAFGQRYRENTLDSVSYALIGIGKLEINKPISEMTYMELASYCYRDAKIAIELTKFNNELVIKLLFLLARISKQPIEDVCRQGVSNWIKSMMYFEHRRRNYLIPRPDELLQVKGVTVTKAVIKGKKYKGAIVVNPTPGIHFNVAVLDFASLYPSIMKNYNLSYETVLCPHEDCKRNKIPETSHWVCKKKKGISSLLIGTLRDLRVKLYKKLAKDKSLTEDARNTYNVIQLTLKVLLNASYGVMGSEAFALYCPPVAESVTAVGRYLITETIKKAQELGINVIYGDTDSLFLEDPSDKQIKALKEWAERTFNIELEVDKIYRYSVFSTRKKNYLGVSVDGIVDIKGLTGKKRHTPEFLKKSFMDMVKILSDVHSYNDFEEAKQRIRELIRDAYKKLKNKEYSLQELAFNVMMGKTLDDYEKTTPQHVKAAKLLADRGYEVKPGDVIGFVKVTGEPGVKPVILASVNEIDTEKYVEYIKSTFEQVLDALGISFDEIIGTSKLEKFFG